MRSLLSLRAWLRGFVDGLAELALLSLRRWPRRGVAYSQAMFGFGVFEFFLLLLVLAALMTWVLRRL